jgi:hypothetical protein
MYFINGLSRSLRISLIISLSILIIFQYQVLYQFSARAQEIKLKDLNSYFLNNSYSLHFVSYIETDSRGSFIWLTDGGEVFNFIGNESDVGRNVVLKFSHNPCGDFVPLKLIIGSNSMEIDSIEERTIDFPNDFFTSVQIYPLKNSSPCQVKGDTRSFFGRIDLS